MAKAVVSIIGHDRPGFISDVTQIADELQLNIEDSRMTVLGGEFAVLMALSGDQAELDRFHQRLEALATDQMSFIYRPTETRAAKTLARPYRATVVAMDHPGIVASIAAFFAAREINIYDLNTTATPAPHTGTPIFNVQLTAEVPASQTIRELRHAFNEFCESHDLDGQLEAKP